MDTSPETVAPQPDVLIVGCGYLGRRLARRLVAMGRTVHGSTRSGERAAKLAKLGVHPLILDVMQILTLASMRPLLDGRPMEMYYLIPPGRPDQTPTPHQVVIEGMAHVLNMTRKMNLRRAVMASSTAVYGQQSRTAVTPDTPAMPANARGRLLLAGESQWLDASAAHHVVRLAGLYGPGRVIGQAGLEQGAPIVGDDQALLNLIHVDDAADLLIAMMACPQPGRVELGSDGTPVSRRTYYEHLARMLGVIAGPRWLDEQAAHATLGIDGLHLRRASNKACDPALTIARTGWQPRFKDFRVGLEQALASGPGRF